MRPVAFGAFQLCFFQHSMLLPFPEHSILLQTSRRTMPSCSAGGKFDIVENTNGIAKYFAQKRIQRGVWEYGVFDAAIYPVDTSNG